MASIETSRREAWLPDGKTITTINVATTGIDEVATNPTRPSGSRLVSREWSTSPHGGREYVFTFEKLAPRGNEPEMQISGQAAQEPIETHPRFNGKGGYGNVTDADLSEIKRALADGDEPEFTGEEADLIAAEELYTLMLKGVTQYFTPSGITYAETSDENEKPSLQNLCKVNNPPSDAPLLNEGQNWLLIGLRAQKIYEPERESKFWRVTREWLASGPRGWNADLNIYY